MEPAAEQQQEIRSVLSVRLPPGGCGDDVPVMGTAALLPLLAAASWLLLLAPGHGAPVSSVELDEDGSPKVPVAEDGPEADPNNELSIRNVTVFMYDYFLSKIHIYNVVSVSKHNFYCDIVKIFDPVWIPSIL